MAPKPIKVKQKQLIVGWREWVTLPFLGVDEINAKIDTGARTSALHAYDIEEYHKHGVDMVRFKIHPIQRSRSYVISAAAPLIEKRWIKSSVGNRTLRPVISTIVTLGGYSWEIELTLVNRDQMGYRMLLGRQALSNKLNIFINPAKSYLASKNIELD